MRCVLIFEIKEIQEIIDSIVLRPEFEATLIIIAQIAFQIPPRGILEMPNIPTRARSRGAREEDFAL